MGIFAKDIGIDLGTANTLVHVKGRGIIIREPSVVAINKNTRTILAVGDDAKNMIGRTPGDIIAIRPMKDGVIADFDVTQNMLKYFIRRAMGTGFISKPGSSLCAVRRHGSRKRPWRTPRCRRRQGSLPYRRADGSGDRANLPVDEPSGSMIVDIGGGTSEVAVISLGGIVTSKSLRVAGDEFDESIVLLLKGI